METKTVYDLKRIKDVTRSYRVTIDEAMDRNIIKFYENDKMVSMNFHHGTCELCETYLNYDDTMFQMYEKMLYRRIEMTELDYDNFIIDLWLKYKDEDNEVVEIYQELKRTVVEMLKHKEMKVTQFHYKDEEVLDELLHKAAEITYSTIQNKNK